MTSFFLTKSFFRGSRNQFIKNYFKKNPTLGEQLITELNQEVTERIQDLVKNPLRLTMICFSWHKNKGKLPNTKAELYQECVDAFYDWKVKEAFPTTPTERRELNQALGELAKKALEQDSAWFRITHQQICQYLSDPNEEGLGKKAIELGWLNQVGVSEKNSDNKVYTFFHPSFQEYFAACAIVGWDFFLPRDHADHPVEGKIYRIFEAQWKQVFLLWLGRADIDDKSEKEALIAALVNFNDQCGDFYYFRALYMAAVGITEFKNCLLTDEIINTLIELGFKPELGEERNNDDPLAI